MLRDRNIWSWLYFFYMWCLLGGSSFSFRLQVDEHLNNIFESEQPQEINPQNVIL